VKPSAATWFLAFNHNRPAFRGPGQIPLKKAINYAIDRPAMARPFGHFAGKRTDQMLPPGLARAAGIYPIRGADLVAARRWYAKARVKPTTLVVYSWNLFPVATAAQVLAFNLRRLGIDVEVKYFEPRTAVAKALDPDEPFDITIANWAADYWDGAAFFAELLAPDGAANAVHVDNPGIRLRIEAANRLTGETRRRAWADLDVDLMRDDPPWAPFIHRNTRTLVSRSVGCFVQHPLYRVDLVAVCKKR
jgi:ABC-type oligopeptide transport system substrate-binding subunit